MADSEQIQGGAKKSRGIEYLKAMDQVAHNGESGNEGESPPPTPLEDFEKLKHCAEQVSTKISKKEEQYKHAQDMASKLSEENEELRQSNSRMMADLKQKEEELQKSRQECLKVKAIPVNSKLTARQLENESSAERVEIERLTKENTQIGERNKQLQAELKTKENELQERSKEILEYQKKLATALKTIAEYLIRPEDEQAESKSVTIARKDNEVERLSDSGSRDGEIGSSNDLSEYQSSLESRVSAARCDNCQSMAKQIEILQKSHQSLTDGLAIEREDRWQMERDFANLNGPTGENGTETQLLRNRVRAQKAKINQMTTEAFEAEKALALADLDTEKEAALLKDLGLQIHATSALLSTIEECMQEESEDKELIDEINSVRALINDNAKAWKSIVSDIEYGWEIITADAIELRDEQHHITLEKVLLESIVEEEPVSGEVECIVDEHGGEGEHGEASDRENREASEREHGESSERENGDPSERENGDPSERENGEASEGEHEEVSEEPDVVNEELEKVPTASLEHPSTRSRHLPSSTSQTHSPPPSQSQSQENLSQTPKPNLPSSHSKMGKSKQNKKAGDAALSSPPDGPATSPPPSPRAFPPLTGDFTFSRENPIDSSAAALTSPISSFPPALSSALANTTARDRVIAPLSARKKVASSARIAAAAAASNPMAAMSESALTEELRVAKLKIADFEMEKVEWLAVRDQHETCLVTQHNLGQQLKKEKRAAEIAKNCLEQSRTELAVQSKQVSLLETTLAAKEDLLKKMKTRCDKSDKDAKEIRVMFDRIEAAAARREDEWNIEKKRLEDLVANAKEVHERTKCELFDSQRLVERNQEQLSKDQTKITQLERQNATQKQQMREQNKKTKFLEDRALEFDQQKEQHLEEITKRDNRIRHLGEELRSARDLAEKGLALQPGQSLESELQDAEDARSEAPLPLLELSGVKTVFEQAPTGDLARSQLGNSRIESVETAPVPPAHQQLERSETRFVEIAPVSPEAEQQHNDKHVRPNFGLSNIISQDIAPVVPTRAAESDKPVVLVTVPTDQVRITLSFFATVAAMVLSMVIVGMAAWMMTPVGDGAFGVGGPNQDGSLTRIMAMWGVVLGEGGSRWGSGWV